MTRSTAAELKSGVLPTVNDVEHRCYEWLQHGQELRSVRLRTLLDRVAEVVREHTRAVDYMETHGCPPATETDTGESVEPPCLLTFHAVHDDARGCLADSVVMLERREKEGAAAQGEDYNEQLAEFDTARRALRCLSVLVESLGWVLQPHGPDTQMAPWMAAWESRLREVLATSTCTRSGANAAAAPDNATSIVTMMTENGDGKNLNATTPPPLTSAAWEKWFTEGEGMLHALATFVSATYPCGPWFSHRRKRDVVRSRRLRHPSDVGAEPFAAVLRAAVSVGDDDLVAMSKSVLDVATAYVTCLDTVRRTAVRPAEPDALSKLFAPLNASLNGLTTVCEGVISRREEQRPHAHAVLEAGNVFTWLTTLTGLPCVVAEEAFGSADVYLGRVTARGNVLLLQQESGFRVEEPHLIKGIVRWAAMLREALQRVVLMVLFRYPRVVPWGEACEAVMPAVQGRHRPKPPSTPRGFGEESVPVWRRALLSATTPSTSPTAPAKAPSAAEEKEKAVAAPPVAAQPPSPPASLSPPPPPPVEAAATSTTPVAQTTTVAVMTPPPLAPSCAFDAVTSTWTVRDYHQPLVPADPSIEEGPVFVTLPEDAVQSSHLVHILDCFNTYVTVPVKVKGVKVDHCQHTKLQLVGTIGPVRLYDTERQEMLIETSCPTVYATQVRGLTVHLTGSHETEFIARLSSDINVNVMVTMADGEQEMRELALPAQFVSTVTGEDQLSTTEVKYSG